VEPVIPSSTDQPSTAASREERLAEHEARVLTAQAIMRVARKTAHALNNYLMVFSGGLDIISGALDSDPERVRKMLAHMAEAADEAGKLADHLQAMRGPNGAEPDVLDLGPLVDELAPEIRRKVGPKIEVVVESASEPALVCVDRRFLGRVLELLAANAAEAMPAGGRITLRTRKVRITPEEERSDLPAGTYVTLDVEDTGKGMTADVRANIFQPFFSTSGDPERGWGLSTVWGIAHQSGGTVWVDSTEGEGTTVSLQLPAVAVEPLPEARMLKDEKQAPAGERTVLLVDDESPVRALVTDVLVEAGYEVLPAANGDEALEIARHHQGTIHLLLADLIMPGLNGREVAEHFKTMRPAAKVLFMSGFAADVLKKVSGDVPLPFLAKPFSPADLCAKVREVLEAGGAEEPTF